VPPPLSGHINRFLFLFFDVRQIPPSLEERLSFHPPLILKAFYHDQVAHLFHSRLPFRAIEISFSRLRPPSLLLQASLLFCDPPRSHSVRPFFGRWVRDGTADFTLCLPCSNAALIPSFPFLSLFSSQESSLTGGK